MLHCDCDATRAAKYTGHANASLLSNFFFHYSAVTDRKDFNQR
jgi:hypothetical protein